MTTLVKNTNYAGSAHPKSAELTRWAQKKYAAKFGRRKRFGDKRDAYVASLNTKERLPNPCTSKSLSTMPRRER